MKLPALKSKHTVQQLLKIVLAVAYAILCTLIILPQIDYQAWYPEGIRTFDLPLGIDFSDHMSSTANLKGPDIEDPDTEGPDVEGNDGNDSSNSDISDSQIATTISTLNSRLKTANVSEAHLELENTKLTLETPDGYTNQFFTMLMGKGSLKFLTLNKPVEEFNLDENPFALFDQSNYDESNIKQEHIRIADIMEVNEQYTYIELGIDSDKIDDWNTFAQENSGASFGLSIDNIIHQAWLLPADGTQIMNPTLVITEKEPISLIMLSYLQGDPLPINSLQQTTTGVESTYSLEQMYRMFALIFAVFIAGFIARVVFLKEPFAGAIGTGLIVIGSIALLKLTTMPISILALLTISIISLIILLTRVRAHLPIFGIMLLITLVLQTANSPSLASLGPIFLVFGLFGLVSTFFFKFINIYEED